MREINKQRVLFTRSEAGTSLLELMGALAAGLVILGATLQILSSFQQAFARQQGRLAQQHDLRLSFEILEQELRLAGFGSLVVTLPDTVEFMANVHGFVTNVTSEAVVGQTTLTVDDGQGWPERKLVRVCWNEYCETFTLARAGQRNLLTLTAPISRAIPSGASVSVTNRIRYYSRQDEQGAIRLLRQIDGGASVLVGDIEIARFTYWDERGQTATQPSLVNRVVVEVSLPTRGVKEVREISLGP